MKKKKLVFILNNFLIGGTERVLLEIIKNLDRDKFEINIIAVFGSGPIKVEFRKLGIPIFFAGPKRYSSSLLFKIIWVLCIPLILLRLIVFLRKINPNIIITSLYQSDILGSWASFGLDTKLISIQHDIIKISPTIKWFKMGSFKKASRIIAISNEVKKFLVDYFKIPVSKIEVIYNGIDFDKFLSFQKIDKDWKPIFGIIARLDEIKGHIYILKAFKKLKNEGVRLPRFIFVGDGSERENLEHFVKENDLLNVEFVGEVLGVGEYLKQIDVFVFPSLSEGLGVAIIEALVAKKLIIASNVGGIKELIKHNKTGILVEPTNVDDLYKATRWVLENKDEAVRLRNASFKWINENRHLFDIKNVSKKYLEVLN